MVQPKKKKFALSWIRWLILVTVPILWSALSHFGLLDFFENRTIDWRFRQRGEIEAPIKVIYVDIDSRSTGDIGNWPWSRHYFARVSDALLNVAGVKAIGFDILLVPTAPAEIADRDRMRAGDVELGKLIFRPMAARPPPAIFAASFAASEFRAAEGKVRKRGLPLVAFDSRRPNEIEPPEQTALETPSGAPLSPPLLGLIDTINAGTRTVPAWAPTATKEFRHMAVELARLHWGLPPESVKRHDDRIDFVSGGVVVHTIPLRDKQLVDINWFSQWDAGIHQSIVEVYAYAEMLRSKDEAERKTAQEYFAQDEWKDSVVLIGPVDPLLQDLAPTPMDDRPVPKVSVHGNLLKTIVSGLYLNKPSPWQEDVLVFALTLIISAFAAAGGARGLRSKLTALLLLTAYVYGVFYLFEHFHYVLPLAAPVGAIFTTSFVAITWQLIVEEKQKGRIKGMFGAYVSPELVNRMAEADEEPKLGGHETEITAYFSDIQSFSSFSEKLGSAPLVELMNEYLTACTDIVQGQGGTLDKYIGDAVVAMFGAPIAMKDHAFRACLATQLVHLKLAELRAKWESEGEKWPQIVWRMQSRIGLNSGLCTIGNMGSRTRFNYTMMGDNVNLAARMESGAKQYGAYTMVTETTKQGCEQHGGDRLVFRYLDKIVVKGRSIPVPIYEVVGLKENVTSQTRECLGLFQQGIEKYLAQDWAAAEALFQRSAEIEPNIPGKTPGVESNPSLALINRCHYMREHPPGAGWDGVFHMKEK